MARQEGPHKIVGFIDGKIYYKMNGVYYVKNSSAPSKEKINNDPSFKTIRENNCEFGACSSVGSYFKKAFGSVLDNFKDNHLTGRLTSLFSDVIHRGKGEHGKRAIQILPNKDLFIGFGFKENICFSSIFKVNHYLTVTEDRKEVDLIAPAFEVQKGIAKISGASHFRILLCLLCFSDYEYDSTSKKYLAVEPALNKIIVSGYSPLIEINGNMKVISLTEKLSTEAEIPETIGIFACVGIEFYQETGGEMYLLESGSCMKIAEVF